MDNTKYSHQSALARQKDLVVQELPDELMVYDLKRHKAHCLNTTAAIVWNHCNGQTTVAEMAALLEQEIGSPVDEEVVLYALDKLEKANLLEDELNLPALSGLSRRRMMKRLGVGAMAAIPTVMSLVAPVAAHSVTVVVTSKKVADGTCDSPPGPHPNPRCFTDTCCTGEKKLCVGNSSNSDCVGTPCQPAGAASDCNQ
ncbi:MAG: PqqD family protein [Blastocatellia bacterium]